MNLVVRTGLPTVKVVDERGIQIGTAVIEDGIATIDISDEMFAAMIREMPNNFSVGYNIVVKATRATPGKQYDQVSTL